MYIVRVRATNLRSSVRTYVRTTELQPSTTTPHPVAGLNIIDILQEPIPAIMASIQPPLMLVGVKLQQVTLGKQSLI